jgi:hypothetical protein
MDTATLFSNMLQAALGAAKGHAGDLKNYLEARTALIARGVAAIAADRLDPVNPLTDDDVRFAFEQIRKSEKTAALAVQATTRAAAQDAINAALAVAAAAANAAIGITIL